MLLSTVLRAARSSATKAASRALPAATKQQTRSMSIAGAAAAAGIGGAAGGGAFRVFGYNIPWPAIVGVSIASVVGVYAYETKKISDVDRQPLTAEVMKKPLLPEGATMTGASGKKIDVAATLRDKHALMAFGALHSTDQPILERMGKAAESAKQRTGFEIVPVYISLDPTHDKPDDLKVAAGRSGSPSMLVVSGPPDGLLGAAERFKNTQMAREYASHKGTELAKKAGDAALSESFVSDFFYIIDQSGHVVGMLPKNMSTAEASNIVAEEVQRTAVTATP